MTAYEFYWVDKRREAHFLGILPERRKNRGRITEKSIMNWGEMVLNSNRYAKKFYFLQVEVPDKVRNILD